jgi:pyridoxal phosphate enzyme (YggS family)
MNFILVAFTAMVLAHQSWLWSNAMSEAQQQIATNLAQVQQRIAHAAQQAGRQPSEIQLVGVSKYVNAELSRALYSAGCVHLGEARPQALWEKAEALADIPIRWHLIGHLQRNKVRRTLPLLSLWHSGDSWRLLEAVNHEAGLLGRTIDTLLEVNISGEAAKHGFSPEELLATLPLLTQLSHIRVVGLMSMAGLTGGRDRARADFARLRTLRDEAQRVCPENIQLKELSMGMSGDYEDAILEGATLVRVGSALWEGVVQDEENAGT